VQLYGVPRVSRHNAFTFTLSMFDLGRVGPSEVCDAMVRARPGPPGERGAANSNSSARCSSWPLTHAARKSRSVCPRPFSDALSPGPHQNGRFAEPTRSTRRVLTSSVEACVSHARQPRKWHAAHVPEKLTRPAPDVSMKQRSRHRSESARPILEPPVSTRPPTRSKSAMG